MDNTTSKLVEIDVQFHVVDYTTGHTKYEMVKLHVPKYESDSDIVDEEKVFRHLDQYVEDMNKHQLMIDRNWHTILNWSFTINENIVKDFFIMTSNSVEFLKHVDFVYSTIKPVIEHLTPSEQIKIILKCLDIAISSVSTTVQSFKDIIGKGAPKSELTKHLERYKNDD